MDSEGSMQHHKHNKHRHRKRHKKHRGVDHVDDNDLLVIDEVDIVEEVIAIPGSDSDVVVEDQPENDIGHSKKRKHSFPEGENEIKKLVEENEYLKSKLKKLKYTARSISSDDCTKPAIAVHFGSVEMASRHKEDVKLFIQQLMAKESQIGESTTDCSRSSRRKSKSLNLDSSKKVIPDVDTWEVPSYSSHFSGPLQSDEETAEENQDTEILTESTKIKQVCWNCEGDHMIPDCTQPKDQAAIHRNRSKFMQQFGNKQRYHIEEDPRFQNFKPGNISEALQNALCLRDGELPLYIYKMRVLGYPPGWLAEAEVHTSGITMYDSEGKEMADNEEGEITSNREKNRYDPEKIIEYPGFNVAVPEGINDNWRRYGFPPMQEFHQKEFMIRHLNMPLCAPKPAGHISSPLVRREEQDMDFSDPSDDELDKISGDEGKPHPPTEVSFKPPLPPGPCPSNVTSPECEFSLEELEKRKELLMKELQSDSDETPQMSPVHSPMSTPTSSNPMRRFISSSSSASKSFSLGTPVIHAHSPFSALPEPERFQTGITEHIPYENLPGATGVFDKLSGVLKIVRNKLKRISK